MSQELAVVDPWQGQATVPLFDVARVAGVPRHDLRHCELKGLIKHAGRLSGPGVGRGKGGAPVVTHDEALFLLRCALIALAAGVAVATVVRVMRGIDVNPNMLAALLRSGKAGGAVMAA